MQPTTTMPILLIPGLASSARTYLPVVPALWRFGPVTIANHIRDDSMAAIARRILDEAPPRFALAGHSMGGYIAFEIIRQAPARVSRLALINTQARPDTPAASERRRQLVASSQTSGAQAVIDALWPNLVHPSRLNDAALKQLMQDMAADLGPDAFRMQQTAIMGRADSRPTLSTIACPTWVLTGDQDNVISNSLSVEMADAIPGATLVVLPNCGHMSTNERPEAAATALTEWLSG